MRVAVLAGGRTPERDVSLRSGQRVSHALVEGGHDAWVVDPGEVSLVEALQERAPDVCYLTLHGKEGEDGTVQRLLDLLRHPVHGNRAVRLRGRVRQGPGEGRAGARRRPHPEWLVVEGWALRDLGAGAALSQVTDRVGLPCVVKPSRSGSALGVSFVERASDLAAAVMAALSFAGAAIVEAKVEGSEVAVGVVGTPPDAEALPLVEIVPKSGVFDYAARYTAGATEYFAPARVAQRSRPPAPSRRSGRRAGSTCVTWRGWTRSSTRMGNRGCSRSTSRPG